MACKVRNERLSAIYDTIKALVKENGNITSLDDVRNWFGVNRPLVLPEEITDALIATSPKKIDEAKKGIEQRMTDLKRQASLVDQLDTLLEGSKEKATRPKLPPSKESQKLTELLSDLTEVGLQDQELTDEVFGDLISKVDNINLLYGQSFSAKSKEAKQEAIKRAVENIKELKRNMDLNRLNSRIKELEGRLEALSSEDIDASALLDPDTGLVDNTVDLELAISEGKIQDLKLQIEERMNDIRLRQKSKQGFFGFNGKTATKLRYTYERIKQEAWEAPRSMAFMADLSAWGVQLSPVLAEQSTNVDFKALAKGDFSNAFASQRKMAEVFNDSVVKLFSDEVKNNESNKATKGIWARQKLREIKQDPLYQVMKDSGLKISESKTLTNSEEVYTSNVFNKVPFLGVVKDFSEDTMVTTLNLYRTHLFKQFYNMADGTLSQEDTTRAAEFINNMTGTSSVNTGRFLSMAMSAPKLLIARLKLAFQEPLKLVGRLDVKRTAQERKIKWTSPTDAFIAKKMLGMWRGYALWAAMLASIPGIEFGEDPEESDFLRVRVGDTSIDNTGGIGSLYRMIAKMYTSAIGVSDDASFTAKQRARSPFAQKDPLDLALTTLVKYRLHPTTGVIKSVATGKDFFGKPFNDIFGAGEVNSRLEGALRGALPISLQTMLDQFAFTPNSGLTDDLFISSLQVMGLNTFEYSDRTQDLRVKNYFDEIKYKPKISYPKSLSGKKKTLESDFIRDKYKEQWSNSLGQIILDHDSDPNLLSKPQLINEFKAEKKQLDKEFLKEFGSQIKQLENK